VSGQSLESLLKGAGNTVDLLRNSQVGAYVYPVVPIEFSNWRSEQVAWQKTAVLFDQSHHMAELTVSGPDALRLLSHLTINSFANFTPNKAKQMVPCSYDGYVIGDGILFYLDKDELLFVGRTPTVNWIQFHAETGGYKVQVIRDDRSPSHPRGKPVFRRHYRYQIQGPNAAQVLEKLKAGRLKSLIGYDEAELDDTGNIELRCWACAAGALGERKPDVVSMDPSWHHNYASLGWTAGHAEAQHAAHYPSIKPELVELTSALHELAHDAEKRAQFMADAPAFADKFQLPPEQRGLIEMGFFGGATHQELARRTDTPLGTVKTRIRSGLKRMRESLGERVSR